MDESTLESLGESLAGNNEWVSSGILVQVHESIDPISQATQVDLASTLGFAHVGRCCFPFDLTCVSYLFSHFRIIFSN
jgi:hypothetical protein